MEVRGRARYCGFVVVDGVPGVLTACWRRVSHELRGLECLARLRIASGR